MRLWDDVDYRLLTSRNVRTGFGVDVLDDDDQLVRTLVGGDQGVVVGGEIERVNRRAVHGTVVLDLLTTLPPMTRVRPWQHLTAGPNSRRYYLGVYVLTTIPDQPLGEDPPTISHEGFDKLHLLQHIVGDTYVVPIGTGYLAAVRQALIDAGYTGLPPMLAGDAEGKTLDEPMVWVLDASEPMTWIGVINALLKKVGYRGLWVDHLGRFRSEPYQTPAVRPVEWVHDLRDPRVSVVSPERTWVFDEFRRINWWRVIQDGMDTRPVETAGQYTVDRRDGAPKQGRIEVVQAADQASLVAQGDQFVDEDTRSTQQVEILTGPMPILGHFDVATLDDPAVGARKVMSAEHTITLDPTEGDVSIRLEVVA